MYLPLITRSILNLLALVYVSLLHKLNVNNDMPVENWEQYTKHVHSVDEDVDQNVKKLIPNMWDSCHTWNVGSNSLAVDVLVYILKYK